MVFLIIWTIIGSISVLVLLACFMVAAGAFVYYSRKPAEADETMQNNISACQQNYPKLAKVLEYLGKPIANWLERLES